MSDLYAVLGTTREATAEGLRKAYRKLARQWHPDLNPSAEARRRFHRLQEAWDVLGNPERRNAYDRWGDESLVPGFDAIAAGRREQAAADPSIGREHGDMSAFHDIFGGLFDDTPGPADEEPPAVDTPTVSVEAMVTYLGGDITVSVKPSWGRSYSAQLTVPAGTQDGERLTAHAGPGRTVLVRVQVRPHPTLERDGNDLRLKVPVPLRTIVSGGSVVVPTPTGQVRIKAPPGCAGKQIRLRGRGVQRPAAPGNLLVTLTPRLPQAPNAEVLAALDALDAAIDRSRNPWDTTA